MQAPGQKDRQDHGEGLVSEMLQQEYLLLTFLLHILQLEGGGGHDHVRIQGGEGRGGREGAAQAGAGGEAQEEPRVESEVVTEQKRV